MSEGRPAYKNWWGMDAETIDVPVIEGAFPVVLYLGSEEDREELIQALMEVHPNMRSKKL